MSALGGIPKKSPFLISCPFEVVDITPMIRIRLCGSGVKVEKHQNLQNIAEGQAGSRLKYQLHHLLSKMKQPE
jgi:hypothetical protein